MCHFLVKNLKRNELIKSKDTHTDDTGLSAGVFILSLGSARIVIMQQQDIARSEHLGVKITITHKGVSSRFDKTSSELHHCTHYTEQLLGNRIYRWAAKLIKLTTK
jgi:hypothetical protein